MDIINKTKFEQPMIPLELGELPQAKFLELEELEDLLQLTTSNQDHTLYHLGRDGDHFYLIWIVIHDFYNLNGLPIVIFVRTNQEPTRFIKYRPDLGKIAFVEKVQESSAAYIRLIKIKQLPFCLDLAV
ncbi:MAG: hypothetical protein HWN66_19335 [Candidatus Helarchaeota archaeon]|nr:hypothetical protein [Candidatus Helarchaeota archaeon]